MPEAHHFNNPEQKSLVDRTRSQDINIRILDAAKTLLIRWGYAKITMDDIAKEAGVSKATVYLRWKTREALFEALIKRERIGLAEEIKQRITNDAEGNALRKVFKHLALALIKRPLIKAILLSDMEVLGKWARREQSSSIYAERVKGFIHYLEMLREQGLIRTDLNLRAQVYLVSAVLTGFLRTTPLMPDEFTLSDEELAELMAETVYRTLQVNEAAPSQAFQNVSHHFIQYIDHAQALVQEQFQKEINE